MKIYLSDESVEELVDRVVEVAQDIVNDGT